MATAALQVIKTANLSEQVYAEIRSALMEGRYEPGERLTISGLSKGLGVSITPVREAIFRLVSDRVLVLKAATAIQVPEVSVEQLREIQKIRMLLEGEAAAVAATKCTPKLLATLEGIRAKFHEVAKKNGMKSAILNRQFHFTLIEASEMPLLAATVENMWVLMGGVMRAYLQHAPNSNEKNHGRGFEEILSALRAGDSERARAAVQDDIRGGYKIVAWMESKALRVNP